jgi:hypothetical protein
VGGSISRGDVERSPEDAVLVCNVGTADRAETVGPGVDRVRLEVLAGALRRVGLGAEVVAELAAA